MSENKTHQAGNVARLVKMLTNQSQSPGHEIQHHANWHSGTGLQRNQTFVGLLNYTASLRLI